MEFYARKLSRNGRWTWEEKNKGMKFLLKYLYRKKTPKDHIPGVTGITRPKGTESEPFDLLMKRKEAELQTRILKDMERMGIKYNPDEIDENIFQDDEEADINYDYTGRYIEIDEEEEVEDDESLKETANLKEKLFPQNPQQQQQQSKQPTQRTK